jgi:heme/copper-type cytochrome/quinol oxidase subunit 2
MTRDAAAAAVIQFHMTATNPCLIVLQNTVTVCYGTREEKFLQQHAAVMILGNILNIALLGAPVIIVAVMLVRAVIAIQTASTIMVIARPQMHVMFLALQA